MLKKNHIAILFVAFIATAALLPAAATFAADQEPVKVFILTGQSNMEGKGLPTHLDTYKNDPLIKDTYSIIKKDDKWTVRDDAWITYPTKNGGAKQGPLTVGYGTKGEESIGPEFGFGHTVAEAIDAPVLIIKIAWGGKSVVVDFRPPSAGDLDEATLEGMLAKAKKKNPSTTMEEIKAKQGHYYRALVEETKKAMASAGTTFPELKGRDLEIAGIVWHQGFNDKVNGIYPKTGEEKKSPKDYTKYGEWLAMLIKDLRKDLGAPNAPFVIGELSTGGIPSRGTFQQAQAAPAKLPEFKGNVAFVPTAEYYDTAAHELYKKNYWKGTDEQKAQWKAVGNDRPYHYLGSGKTYYLKGQAFGKAMLDMMQK